MAKDIVQSLQLILPGLWQFRSQLSGVQQPVNGYVLQCGKSVIIIDPPADLTPQTLTQAGLGAITHILCTHMQAENLGGAAEILKAFPAAKLHVPAGDEYLCKGIAEYESHIQKWVEPWEWETRGLFKGHLGGARNERPLPAALPLADSLQAGKKFLDIDILATPGHGKNALTFLITLNGTRVAFCGDLIVGDGQLWNWFDSDWDYGTGVGFTAMKNSLLELKKQNATLLCPTHGAVIRESSNAIATLQKRLAAVLDPIAIDPKDAPLEKNVWPINFPEIDSPVTGFRQILPNLHQWRSGNCAVLISKTGNALVVDDGLCHWVPMPARIEHHNEIFSQLKKALNIRKIDLIVPTHYHGDHTENIPRLAAAEGAKIVALDVVAEAIEFPERFNLACPLPWYDTDCGIVKVDQRMTDGQHLQWHEFDLEFFHLGGQTYYTNGVQVTIDGVRTIFVGDSFNMSLAPEITLSYNDCEPLQRGWFYALEKLLARQPDLIVGGHGMASKNPMPLMRAKRRYWEPHLAAIKALSFRASSREFFDPFFN